MSGSKIYTNTIKILSLAFFCYILNGCSDSANTAKEFIIGVPKDAAASRAEDKRCKWIKSDTERYECYKENQDTMDYYNQKNLPDNSTVDVDIKNK